jgi:ribosomal protein L37AE/L43A
MSDDSFDYIITGFPSCPSCGKILELRSMPGIGETHWYCNICGNWTTPDLIAALEELESF